MKISEEEIRNATPEHWAEVQKRFQAIQRAYNEVKEAHHQRIWQEARGKREAYKRIKSPQTIFYCILYP